MNNLAGLKDATKSLSPADKQQLLMFLAASLRSARRQMPEPRQFTREQLATWIEEDEADMKEHPHPALPRRPEEGKK